MAVELVPLQQGVEQTFVLDYNDTSYKFALSFDDYYKQWFINITESETGNAVVTGIYLIINSNVFSQLKYLGFGSLSLVDTTPDSSNELDIENDLGVRLKLYRDANT